ncbi:MAG: heterocyst frequency control protein PatD [Cyanobacteria bacterium J06607_15]
MLSASHNRAYQDFITLLTKFAAITAEAQAKNVIPQIQREFLELKNWFEQNIVQLGDRQIEAELVSRWQSVQTEIRREFKLLSTDILFLATSRQPETQQKRLKSINSRLSKLIGYCQIMLPDSD